MATKHKNEESIVEKVAYATEDVWEKVGGAAEEIIENIGEAVEHVVETAAEAVEEATEELSDDGKKTKKKSAKKKEIVKEEKVSNTIDDKKAKLKAKLEALQAKFKDIEKVNIKEKVTGERSEPADTLVPIEDYLKASMHLGTRVITPQMRKYIYKRRADGLAVFNTAMIDAKMREAGAYLAKFAPEDIIVVCKREAGWKAVKLFSETLGIRSFMKKYPAGVLTNTNLKEFFECKLAFICDPWLDKNALTDSNIVGVPVLGICDSNNYHFGMDQFIVGNNKSAKSLGMIMYLMTKIYVEHRKLDVALPGIEQFIDDWENLVPPK